MGADNHPPFGLNDAFFFNTGKNGEKWRCCTLKRCKTRRDVVAGLTGHICGLSQATRQVQVDTEG